MGVIWSQPYPHELLLPAKSSFMYKSGHNLVFSLQIIGKALVTKLGVVCVCEAGKRLTAYPSMLPFLKMVDKN